MYSLWKFSRLSGWKFRNSYKITNVVIYICNELFHFHICHKLFAWVTSVSHFHDFHPWSLRITYKIFFRWLILLVICMSYFDGIFKLAPSNGFFYGLLPGITSMSYSHWFMHFGLFHYLFQWVICMFYIIEYFIGLYVRISSMGYLHGLLPLVIWINYF